MEQQNKKYMSKHEHVLVLSKRLSTIRVQRKCVHVTKRSIHGKKYDNKSIPRSNKVNNNTNENENREREQRRCLATRHYYVI